MFALKKLTIAAYYGGVEYAAEHFVSEFFSSALCLESAYSKIENE